MRSAGSLSGSGTLTNQGLILRDGNPGTTSTVAATLVNHTGAVVPTLIVGAVDARSGTLSFTGAVTQRIGDSLVGGRWVVESTGTLLLPGGDIARVTGGLSEVVLLDHADGMLPWLPAGVLKRDIHAAMVERRPDVVVTFGEDGLYWHPDHIATGDAVRAAVASLGGDAPALFHVTMPPGQMRGVLDAAAPRLPPGARRDLLGLDDPDAFGAAALPPSLILHIGRFAACKLAALRCHRTQVAGGPFDHLEPAEAEALLGVEHYRRAAVGSQAPAFIECLAGPLRETA